MPAFWKYPHDRLHTKKNVPQCRPGRTCIFSKAHPGSAALIRIDMTRCEFCDRSRFESTIEAGGNSAGKIFQSLIMIKRKDEDVFREAIEEPHIISKVASPAS